MHVWALAGQEVCQHMAPPPAPARILRAALRSLLLLTYTRAEAHVAASNAHLSCHSNELPEIREEQTRPFSKQCLFLSDTRHFRRFRRFRGSEEQSPCFQWVECKFVIFAVFVKTAPFWQETKTRFVPPRRKATDSMVEEPEPGTVGTVFPGTKSRAARSVPCTNCNCTEPIRIGATSI